MGLIDDSKRINDIDVKEERAILVGLITPQQGEAKAREYLDELEFLAETAGATTVRTFLQRCDGPNSTSYVGKGKLEEIVAYVEENDINLVIFDDDLTPKQVATAVSSRPKSPCSRRNSPNLTSRRSPSARTAAN